MQRVFFSSFLTLDNIDQHMSKALYEKGAALTASFEFYFDILLHDSQMSTKVDFPTWANRALTFILKKW